MHFITDQEDATTIFRLKEQRLDSRNAGQLKAEFLILAQPDIDTLIVDLSDVQHVDSAGLSALLLAQRQMRIHEGELRLVGLNEDIRSLLEVTQMDRIFRIFNSVQEALKAKPLLVPNTDEEEFTTGEAEGEDEMFGSRDGKSDRPEPLGPDAPSAKAIRAGAIVAGGSFGAAVLAEIMMTPFDEELDRLDPLILGDEEDLDDDEEDTDLDDIDDDLEDDDDDDDLDEEDDVEEEPAEDAVEAPEDLVEDDDFEDDDWDDEELEEDEEEDY